MIRVFQPSRALTTGLLASLVALLGACDSDGSFTLVPEVESTAGFEGTLDGWASRADQFGTGASAWSVQPTDEVSNTGTGSLAVSIETLDGTGRVWIERDFQVEPGVEYEVTLTYRLGTPDGAQGVWSLVAGGWPDGASVSLPVRGDTGAAGGGAGVQWVERSHTFRVTAGAGTGGTAAVTVAVGVVATSADSRTYYLDDLSVVMYRAS